MQKGNDTHDFPNVFGKTKFAKKKLVLIL